MSDEVWKKKVDIKQPQHPSTFRGNVHVRTPLQPVRPSCQCQNTTEAVGSLFHHHGEKTHSLSLLPSLTGAVLSCLDLSVSVSLRLLLFVRVRVELESIPQEKDQV